MGIKSVYIHRIISSSFLAILISLLLYVLESDQNKLQIMIFNKTGYALDSLEFEGHYFHLANSDSLTLNNYESISVQDSIPLGLPQAKINGHGRQNYNFPICGNGIIKVVYGIHKYDVTLRSKQDSTLLIWQKHQ